jgi:hypothetical protein
MAVSSSVTSFLETMDTSIEVSKKAIADRRTPEFVGWATMHSVIVTVAVWDMRYNHSIDKSAGGLQSFESI